MIAPRKAVVKSLTAPFESTAFSPRHQDSGDGMRALDLQTKPLLAVPTGVARPEHTLDAMVIPAHERPDGVIVDANERTYEKVAKVTATNLSEIFLVKIPDSVQSQLFVGKQVRHPEKALVTPSKMGARRGRQPKALVQPGPFNNPELENEVSQTLRPMVLEGKTPRPSPFATHAVLVTDSYSMMLSPVGRADAFNVLQDVYQERVRAVATGNPAEIHRAQTRRQKIVRLLMGQVLGELVGCHAQDLQHRDLKLENIFLTEGGSFSISDFGLTAKANCFDGKLGTHQAPEGHLGHPVEPKKLDVWALSVAAMQLACDQILFPLSTQALYAPNTFEGRTTLRADMKAYTDAWIRAGGVLTDDQAVALQKLYRDGGAPQTAKTPKSARPLAVRTASSRSIKSLGKRRTSRSDIAAFGSSSSLSNLTRVNSAPMVEVDEEWDDDFVMKPESLRDLYDDMQRKYPDIATCIANLVAAKENPEAVADDRATVVEVLESLQEENSSVYPTLFMLSQIVDESVAKKLDKEEMSDAFAKILASNHPLNSVWRQLDHGLSFSEGSLSAKFAELRDALREDGVDDDEPSALYTLILNGLHPLPSARPSAQEMFDAMAELSLDLSPAEIASVQGSLKQIEGLAWRKLKEVREKEPERARFVRRASERLDDQPRRHSVASPRHEKFTPYDGSPLKQEESSPSDSSPKSAGSSKKSQRTQSSATLSSLSSASDKSVKGRRRK